MKPKIFAALKTSISLVILLFLQAFSTKAPGGDYYKVLLNGKLVTEQFLTQPTAVKALSLTPANQTDRLTVLYSHCGTAGTARVISLRDEKGKTIKNWKFADSKDQSMQVMVKDILGASPNSNTGLVYYFSKELPKGKLLINLNLPKAVTARR